MVGVIMFFFLWFLEHEVMKRPVSDIYSCRFKIFIIPNLCSEGRMCV